MYYCLFSIGLMAVFCAADEEYEVEDDFAILTAEYRKTQGTQSYVTYLFAIAIVAIIGMMSVCYVRFTWKERMEAKVQNLQENMTNYAVISRQAHLEEVASLQRRHNKELSDMKLLKDTNDKRISELTNEKRSNESKLLGTKRELERCQQDLLAAETENQRLITVNMEVKSEKNLEIQRLKVALEKQKTENYAIHSTAEIWEKKAKDLELELDTIERKNTNLQREINDLRRTESSGFMRRFRVYNSANRPPAETTATIRVASYPGSPPPQEHGYEAR